MTAGSSRTAGKKETLSQSVARDWHLLHCILSVSMVQLEIHNLFSHDEIHGNRILTN